MSIGARIKSLRAMRGFTQDDMAEKLNMNRANFSNYERDKAIPPGETLVKIAEMLNTTTDYLLGRTTDYSAAALNVPTVAEESGRYLAYLGGPKEELTPEEAEHLEQELEMFRALKEKRLREQQTRKVNRPGRPPKQ